MTEAGKQAENLLSSKGNKHAPRHRNEFAASLAAAAPPMFSCIQLPLELVFRAVWQPNHSLSLNVDDKPLYQPPPSASGIVNLARTSVKAEANGPVPCLLGFRTSFCIHRK